MLSDTNRPTSVDLELSSGSTSTEGASSAFGMQDNPGCTEAGGESEQSQRVVCEHLMLKADAYLTTKAGNPSVLCYVAALVQLAWSGQFIYGSVLLPCGISTCYFGENVHDPLWGLSALLGFMNNLIVVPLAFELRRAVRNTPDSPLVLLGAGSQLHSLEADKSVRQMFKRWDATWFTRAYVQKVWFQVVVGLYSMVTGFGFQGPLLNRLSGGGIVLQAVFFAPVFYLWYASFKLAAALCAAKIAEIVSNVENLLASETTRVEWNRLVLEQCKGLITALEVWNEYWGTGLVLLVLYGVSATASFTFGFTALVFLDADHYFRHLEREAPIFAIFAKLVGVTLMALFIAMPYLIVTTPASITSDCIKLKDMLNKSRLNDMPVDIDARVAILERVLDNVNGGQGIGFTVAGVVIDTSKNRRLAASCWSATVLIAPVVYEILRSKTAHQDERERLAPYIASVCQLSQEQAMCALNSTFESLATNLAGASGC